MVEPVLTTDPDPGSNPSDDSMVEVLESYADDPTYQELQEFIDRLTDDEQIGLVTLTWLGRGDGGVDDWCDLRREARRAHNDHGCLSFGRAHALRSSDRGPAGPRTLLRRLREGTFVRSSSRRM